MIPDRHCPESKAQKDSDWWETRLLDQAPWPCFDERLMNVLCGQSKRAMLPVRSDLVLRR